MSRMAPLEIRALSRIMDELDYYQLLHLPPDAGGSELKKAYYASSRVFHPDANKHLDPELQRDCTRISKRLTEAYSVLRDPRRRGAYDAKLSNGEGLRMQLAEARAAHSRKDTEERQGRATQGRQFYQKAQRDLERQDRVSAARNLQMALTFEPENALFKRELEEARRRRS